MSDVTVVRTYGSFNDYPSNESAAYPVSCANLTLGPWSTAFTTTEAFGERKIVTSVRTENYWKRKAKGEHLPVQPFSSVLHRRSTSGYSQFYTQNVAPSCSPAVVYQQNHYRGRYWAARVGLFGLDGVNMTLFPVSRETSLLKEACTRVWAERARGKANYLESLAEIDQAWRLMHSPGENIRKFLDDFIRHKNYHELNRRLRVLGVNLPGNIRQKVKRLKSFGKFGAITATLLSSEWLRFRYGMLPIWRDYQAAVEALSKGFTKDPKYYTAREQRSGEETEFKAKSQIIGPYEYYYVTNQVSTYSVKAWMTDEYVKSIWNHLGFTWYDFIGLPLELKRLSFVYDWFANVGDYYYANIPRVTVTSISSGYFTVREHTLVCAPTKIVRLPPYDATVNGSLSEIVVNHYNFKDRVPQLPNPALVFKDNFGYQNYNRVLDTLALIKNQLRRLPFM